MMNNEKKTILIPFGNDECAMVGDREGALEDFRDAIANNQTVVKKLCINDQTGEVQHRFVWFDQFSTMICDSDCAIPVIPPISDIVIVPNYKCETCGNRMIPSIQKRENGEYAIHYRCPMCCQSCNFDYNNPTWRLRKDD